MSVVQYEQKEFCGKIIRQRLSDGYLNATDMCKANGKLYGHYIDNNQTKEYLNELSTDIGIPISKLIEVKRGGIANQQGTWIHPLVSIHLSQWLSPKFAVQVSKWVLRFMQGDLTLINEIKQNNELMQKERDALLEEKNALLEELKEQKQNSEEHMKNSEEMSKYAKRVELMAKHQTSFKPFSEPVACLYSGICKTERDMYIRKFGSSNDIDERESGVNSGNSPNNRFEIDEIFKVPVELKLGTEKYIHWLLRSLKLEKTNMTKHKGSSEEYFFIHRSFIKEIADAVIKDQKKYIRGINKYIKLLQEYKLDFNKVEAFLYDEVSQSESDTESELNGELESEDDTNDITSQDKSKVKSDNDNKEEPIENLIDDRDLKTRLNDIIKPFKNVKLVLPKKLIQITEIEVICSHGTKTIQVRTLLKGHKCHDCMKEAHQDKLKEKHFSNIIDFDEYDIIELIDEKDEDYQDNSIREKERIHNQNIVINKLETENMRLLSEYTNRRCRLSLLCQYEHKTQVASETFWMQTSDFCSECKKIKKDIEMGFKVFKNANEDELIQIGDEVGWTFLGKSTIRGTYLWLCTKGHKLHKMKRDVFETAYCPECKIDYRKELKK